MSNLITQIESKLQEFRSTKVYIAVSGGMDSMVLLAIVQELGLQPTALHVNYGLRGEESEGDQTLVETYCKENSIPILVNRIDLKLDLIDRPGNLQNRAREVRYDWFSTIAKKEGVVLLAHHADDQIETFLLQLMRGAGLMGLSAMPFKRDIYVRPLLDTYRNDIRRYAEQKNIPWRDDSSNETLKYNRNKLRHEFIPAIISIVPTIKEDILSLVKVFQENQKALTESISPQTALFNKERSIPLEFVGLKNDVELIELLRQLEIPLSLLPEIKKLLHSENGKFISIENGRFDKIIRSEDVLTLFSEPETESPVEIEFEEVEDLPITFSKDVVYLDKEKINGELRVRKWQTGDKIDPIGVKGSQLISKVLHDLKVPHHSRKNIYVLCDDENIHWCIGYKVGRKAIATTESKEIVRCSIIDKES